MTKNVETDPKRRDRSDLKAGAKKHVCVYCDDVSHKSRECTSALLMLTKERKFGYVSTVREHDIELRNIKALVNGVNKDTIPQFV